MKQLFDDIVLVEGNNELSVQMVPMAVAKFAYASGVRKSYSGSYVYFEIDIKNIGDAPGLCSVNWSNRIFVSPYGWSGWSAGLGPSPEVLIDPEKVATFKSWYFTTYQYQIKITSPAGMILDPPEPKEFICHYCWDLYKKVVSFTTTDELNLHIGSAHPQYAPMPPLIYLSVNGIKWPDHFTKYGEDYGKIIRWYTVACLDKNDYWTEYSPPVLARQLNPDDGPVYRDITQPCNFTFPNGWVSAYWDAGGMIPNTTLFRVFFVTNQGWSGFMDDSPWIMRIPDRSLITFEGYGSGCRNWKVE